MKRSLELRIEVGDTEVGWTSSEDELFIRTGSQYQFIPAATIPDLINALTDIANAISQEKNTHGQG